MDKVVKRKSAEAVYERDLRLVTDYKAGFTIEQIMKRNGISSHQTIYNAIDRFNKLLEEQKDKKDGKENSVRES